MEQRGIFGRRAQARAEGKRRERGEGASNISLNGREVWPIERPRGWTLEGCTLHFNLDLSVLLAKRSTLPDRQANAHHRNGGRKVANFPGPLSGAASFVGVERSARNDAFSLYSEIDVSSLSIFPFFLFRLFFRSFTCRQPVLSLRQTTIETRGSCRRASRCPEEVSRNGAYVLTSIIDSLVCWSFFPATHRSILRPRSFHCPSRPHRTSSSS